MRVFLDECIDWRLSRELIGHEVKTARDMGWTSIGNGELLALASRAFDVFVTVDGNIRFQQNLDLVGIPIILLQARTNRLADLRPLLGAIQAALAFGMLQPVTVIRSPETT
jgi:hypothetical protein